VVGAGIAGCSVAHALATRGVRVTLVDAQGVAQAASGNRAAVLYPQLTKYYGPATEWHLAAYGYVLRLLAQLGGVEYASPGMLKIAKDDADAARLAAIAETLQLDDEIAQWVSAEEGSARVGTPVAQPGFWFAQGTWLSPRSLCARLVDHPNITPHIGTVVEARATTLTLADGAVLEAAGVVLAGAMGVQKFLPHLPMAANAGQVSEARSDAALNAILCHKGYAISPAPGALLIGATYTRDDLSDIVREEAHAHNRAELAVAAPALEAGLQITGGRVSLRATTPRRVPYVGRCGAMWVSAGHGSRGMLSAPLAAEVIAAAWCGEPMPVTQAVQALLQPPVPA
jgi:tRNA 5-methylaminomethyl-2-thiouridine biosynthesis bifunctional protein